MLYFCQGCSAVLERRINYCPFCGSKQLYDDACPFCGAELKEDDEYCPECNNGIDHDEDKTRYCPNCGTDLDMEGRNLDLKYCFDGDCSMEIGGLIRYSEDTGKELSFTEMLIKNNYGNALSDWLSNEYNAVYNDYIPCYRRMLYIYDSKKEFSIVGFAKEIQDTIEGIYIHHLKDFDALASDETLSILSDKEKHLPAKHEYCICIIEIGKYEKMSKAHSVFEKCLDKFISDLEYEPDVSFIFISQYLPEETKVRSIYDKRILAVTPEIVNSFSFKKVWGKIRNQNSN
jgi:RNA polymerase subunit RPABC4/transcription elongation factor Spt4